MSLHRQPPPPTWEKVKPPARFGPFTLLEGGEFSVPNWPTFHINMALQNVDVPGGTILTTAHHQLRILCTNGAELLANYENTSWFRMARRNETDAASPPVSLPSAPWPSLPSFNIEGLDWAKDHLSVFDASEIPTASFLSTAHHASYIVDELRRLGFSDVMAWSESFQRSEHSFGLLVIRPHLGDTSIVTEVSCKCEWEHCHVTTGSRILLRKFSSETGLQRFVGRLALLFWWLLVGTASVAIASLKPEGIENWMVLAGMSPIAIYTLLKLSNRSVKLDYPEVSFGHLEAKALFNERAKRFGECLPLTVISTLMSLSYQGRHSTILTISLLFLPGAFFLLLFALHRGHYLIDTPTDHSKERFNDYHARHTVIHRVVSGVKAALSQS